MILPIRTPNSFQSRGATRLFNFASMAALVATAAFILTPAFAQQRPAPPPIPAFPGAEGAGAMTKGGRGGRVIEVTNLDDSGPGSLRAAVEAGGPRTVVFRVSGIIDLQSDLVIRNPFITIAGQTAPGDGICLKRHPLRMEKTHDVVIRYLRVRVGDEAGKPFDGIEARETANFIVDHCSVSWSMDEGINTWHGCKNVTVQWCFVAEPLDASTNRHPHAYGASLGGQDASFHHNLFAHCTARNPSVAGNHQFQTVNMDFRCNLIYNWQHRTCDGKPMSCNIVNNYYKPGPATHDNMRRRIVRIEETKNAYGFDNAWYIEGNMMEGSPDSYPDNWKPGTGAIEYEPGKKLSEELNRSKTPFPFAPVTTQPAPEVYDVVLENVGATLPRRDAIDTRVLGEVKSGKAANGKGGIIDTQTQAGGWPVYNSTPAPVDSDHDGMPDAWERLNGFNPYDPADGSADADRDGYTNLEEYLNGTNSRENAGRRPGGRQQGQNAAANAPETLDARLNNGLAAYVKYFNTMESEPVINLVPNSESLAWLEKNIPLFECPDADLMEIYYFRWWAVRKHLRIDKASNRQVFTEFILKERPVSSALGLQLSELRWLRDQTPVDDYVLFWLRGNNGKPQDFLHKYSGWLQYALLQRACVTGDSAGLLGMFDDLVADYKKWETEKQLPSGLFWQFDVWDAMEESISGSRTIKNIRPTINSYMFANARALATMARELKRDDLAAEFDKKAANIKQLALASMWDADAKFFKVRLVASDTLSDAREAIGFIPWYFSMPDTGRGYEEAWKQAVDTNGFRAPYGFTTAERRHPLFRSHGIGTCEWDGAVWPYASSQTLVAMANVVRDYPQNYVTRSDYFDSFITYARAHRYDDMPYIGEYQDEVTGYWLKGNNPRSSWYHHSSFADHLITGVIGLRPRVDNRVELSPLLPEGSWPWFCIDGVKYHGRTLTILWDKDGTRYNRGAGLRVFADGKEIGSSPKLDHLLCELP